MLILSSSGTISTQDLAPAGNSPTPLSFVQLPAAQLAVPEGAFIPLPPDTTHVGISVSGTGTGLLNVNGTEDGINWQVLGGYPVIDEITGIESENIPSGQDGLYVVNVVGLMGLRVDAPNAVTGSYTVSMNASNSMVGPRGPINPLSTGAQRASLAASSSDQVASAQSGQLVRVTVLTSGSAATSIYDNASAGSGTLLGVIPASPTVGAVYTFQTEVVNGITVKGAANTSGLLVVFD